MSQEDSWARERRLWADWEAGRGRCPYCVDQSPVDWDAICDCGLAERCMTRHEVDQLVLLRWGRDASRDPHRASPFWSELRGTIGGIENDRPFDREP